jgi:hypothetical protein
MFFKSHDPFAWITHSEHRRVIANDSREAQVCYQQEAYTACQAMIGSVIEGVLSYALRRMRVAVAEHTTLEKLIQLAKEHLLLPAGEAYLAHAIRDYRNLLHPRKRIAENRFSSKENAQKALGVYESVMKEVETKVCTYAPIDLVANLSCDGVKMPVYAMPFTIGRKEGNNFTLECSSVSKLHLQITLQDNIFYLQDMGSTNGTYFLMDDKEIPLRKNRPVALASGTVFRLGKKQEDPQITFWVEGESATEMV